MLLQKKTCRSGWIDKEKDTGNPGLGLWAMILQDTGAMIGQAGLTLQPYKNTRIPEIGYLLKKEYRHRGYAKEAAAGCRDYAFRQLNCGKVYSIIRADNIPSIHVAEKIGMKKEDEFVPRYYGAMRCTFSTRLQKQILKLRA